MHHYSPAGLVISRKALDAFHLAALFEESPSEEHRHPVRLARELLHRLGLRGRATHLSASDLITARLIQEIQRSIVRTYMTRQRPGVMREALEWVEGRYGAHLTTKTFEVFVEIFPPWPVYAGELTVPEYLAGETNGVPNREVVCTEFILVALACENPAMRPLSLLFEDGGLISEGPGPRLMAALAEFFALQPAVEIIGDTLFECLRRPMRVAPTSLKGQLDFIRSFWGGFLPAEFREQLLLAGDIVHEETVERGFGPGPVTPLEFRRRGAASSEQDFFYAEPERFSEDADWMSNVVLIAKSTYVWLDQLSKQYGRSIHRLDQVPDEELDRLARWGFSALWLIGVWERSPASERIKKISGNLEAAASAYSVYDYEIAKDLGGEEALFELRGRAMRRGIRLASDMVPNHVGLYSKWVVEHPDWFLQLDHPPFPVYRFTGEDLSHDPRVSIYIEDGYWTQGDAAVVFKRVDNATGETRYIYHGNDGTNMPWNDTAQLDYTIPEVREAVIQTILHVARLFPIIRFDAAMTLAKRHYQRLWFPKPGDGGAVPSRSGSGLSRAEFDERMPEEFWRQVVDRIGAEAPDTLLLAEAFWLMEGYFVRTLGMHRVYNSAFMNMLKVEENLNYRTTVRNVLEFSPQVLKRFVNFMSNPDEATAIEQFGAGDKYLGVAVMSVTMPGLPMFGHGQIEGFREKYGMEYRRAYWEETVNEGLVQAHERYVFPLMRRRLLFSGVDHFAFYDFVRPDGAVDENVFAFSNRTGHDRVIVLYSNAYQSTSGRIHRSVPNNRGTDENVALVRQTLSEALDLRSEGNCYYVFREHRENLEYVRSAEELSRTGLGAILQGYGHHVFVDFREVFDRDGSWAQLARELNGAGVASINHAYHSMLLAPVLDAFRGIFAGEAQADIDALEEAPVSRAGKWETIEPGMRRFLVALGEHVGRTLDEKILDEIRRRLEVLWDSEAVLDSLDARDEERVYLSDFPRNGGLGEEKPSVSTAWAILQPIESALGGTGRATGNVHQKACLAIDELLLTGVLTQVFAASGCPDWAAKCDADLVRVMLRHGDGLSGPQRRFGPAHLKRLLEDPMVQDCLGVNEYEGVIWLKREPLEQLAYGLLWMLVIELATDLDQLADERADIFHAAHKSISRLLRCAEEAGYRLEQLTALL